MTSISEVLREADPLRFEPRRSIQARRMNRRLILKAASAAPAVRQRTWAIGVVPALILIATAVIGTYWSRTAVNLIAAVRFEARLAEETPAAGLRETKTADSERTIYLHQEVVVSNSDIAQARVVPGNTPTTFSVTVEFNAAGAMKMLKATESHIGKPLAILLDGELVMAPTVRGPASTSAVITGNFTRAEAERIATGLLGQ
jgi:preprotein translocase subunit SecD